MTASDSSIGIAPRAAGLGRYRLIAELARGGMGIVYLGLVCGPARFNKLFVLKELKPHLAEDPALVRMFLDEARLAAKLAHPNVVQTIEVGCEASRPFIAMEYLEGQSLHRVLQRARAARGFSLSLHVLAVAAALEGLHHAHSLCDFDGTPLGVVHRDMSPQNVFITYDGQVKVVDFGIAKALDSRDETRTGVLKGKIAYMAPEQALGVPIDRRADVFAAGVMLWEAAAGRRMWAEATNEIQILRALTKGSIPCLRDFAPDAPERLVRIIDKATARSAQDRYPTAAALQEDLAAFLAEVARGLSGRDLARHLSDAFADERRRVRSIVEAQVKRINAEPETPHELLRLEIGEGQPETPSDFSGARLIVPPALSTGPLPVALSQQTPAVSPRRGVGTVVVASVIAATLGAGAVAVFGHVREPAPPRQLEQPLALVQANGRVPLTIRAVPPDAHISVDGIPVNGNPYTTSLANDGAGHVVRVEAAGYRPQEQSFAAETASVLDFSLEPLAAVQAAPRPAPAHPPVGARKARPLPLPVPPKPAAAAAQRGPRPIDKSNPYTH